MTAAVSAKVDSTIARLVSHENEGQARALSVHEQTIKAAVKTLAAGKAVPEKDLGVLTGALAALNILPHELRDIVGRKHRMAEWRAAVAKDEPNLAAWRKEFAELAAMREAVAPQELGFKDRLRFTWLQGRIRNVEDNIRCIQQAENDPLIGE